MASSITFDFITDEDFRSGLESDLREMELAAESGAWKAAHVLAGSVVEALLVDHLIAAGVNEPDPLGMSLGQLIDACRKTGVLSQKTADLSAAVKSFRNLIHPGRTKRLAESADAEGTVVARSLVAMIAREVAASRQERYGFTAEQIAAKFEKDPSASGISKHLLREANDRELERLLLKVVPERYFAELDEEYPDGSVLAGHSQLFRTAFDFAPVPVKKKVLARYVAVLREEPGPVVRVYEEQFFRGSDVEFLTAKDRELVKAHLLSRLKDDPTVGLLVAARGIGPWISSDDVNSFVDPLVRLTTAGTDQAIRNRAKDLLEGEATRTKVEVDLVIVKRLEAWENTYRNAGNEERATFVSEIRAAYIPF